MKVNRMTNAERMRKWRNNNLEYSKEKEHEYYLKNKQRYNDYYKEKYSTLEGKASYLLAGYKANDLKHKRGECTLSIEDVIGLLKSKCVYCGETDWTELGADRIDDSKPHTLENCVCSCWSCNHKKHSKSISQPVLQYTKSMEFVEEYQSAREAERQTGVNHSSILRNCDGRCKTAGGFIWKLK